MSLTATHASPRTLKAHSIKGLEFANVQKYVETTHGPKRWHDVLESLASEDRNIVESALAVGWYELSIYARLLRAIDSVCGNGDLSLLLSVGAFGVEQDFNRIFRVFMRILSPHQVFKLEDRLWRRFYSTGESSSDPIRGGFGVDSTLKGWGVDRALCVGIMGYMVRLIELTGGADVTVNHDECRALGFANCVFKWRWH
jgi:hypothetical protein